VTRRRSRYRSLPKGPSLFTRFCEQAGLQLEPFQKRIAKAYAPKTIHALLSLATKSVKVWQQTVLRLS
jgi:hypothetical protein